LLDDRAFLREILPGCVLLSGVLSDRGHTKKNESEISFEESGVRHKWLCFGSKILSDSLL
jgi:hypothetical protein